MISSLAATDMSLRVGLGQRIHSSLVVLANKFPVGHETIYDT